MATRENIAETMPYFELKQFIEREKKKAGRGKYTTSHNHRILIGRSVLTKKVGAYSFNICSAPLKDLQIEVSKKYSFGKRCLSTARITAFF